MAPVKQRLLNLVTNIHYIAHNVALVEGGLTKVHDSVGILGYAPRHQGYLDEAPSQKKSLKYAYIPILSCSWEF